MYSPRFASIVYPARYEQIENIKKDLEPIIQKIDDSPLYLDDTNVKERLLNNPSFIKKFIDETGLSVKMVKENPDEFEARTILNSFRAINTSEIEYDLENYADEYLKKNGIYPKIFDGYTYSGRRRYLEANQQNVLKVMNKKDRAGETFNYGLGTLRAKLTPKLSESKLQKSKDKIVTTEEFDKIREEMDARYFAIAEEFQQYGKYTQNIFDIERGLNDFIGTNWRAFLDNYNNVPQSLLDKVSEFKKDLIEMPTEYFETKIKGVVNIGEFKYAVVPNDVSEKVIDILNKRGVEIIRYEAGNESDRENKISQISDARFKSKRMKQDDLLTLSKGGDYLADVKDRLKIDFDVYFTDTLLYKNYEAYGAMYDNTIILATFDEMTKAHETMHLLLNASNNLPIFKRAGITKQAVLQAKAKELGVNLNSKNARDIEEELALDFEKYLDKKYKPKGLIARFFEMLRIQFAKIRRAIIETNGDIITDFYDIIDEGIAKDNEFVRLENRGIIASMIDDSGVTDLTDFTKFEPKFKFKDGRLNNLSTKTAILENKYKEYESRLALWKENLNNELAYQMSARDILNGTSKQIKDISKYTYRRTNKNHIIGQLTPKGLELASQINDPELQKEVTAYIKTRIELKDAQRRIRSLRKDISGFKTEKKLTTGEQKVISRQLRKRENQVKFIEQGIEYTNKKVVPKLIKDATKYGKKAKLQEIHNRQAEIISRLKELPLSVRGKVSILNSIRNATTKSQYDKVLAKVNTRVSEYQKARALMKDLSAQRSKIGFLRHIGEMDYALISDVKEQLGLQKNTREMDTFELDMMISELTKRLEFKRSRGFGIESKPMTIEEYQAIADKRASKTKMDRLKEAVSPKELILGFDKLVGTTSTRLYSIAPELSRVVRNWSIKNSENIAKDEKVAKPFLLALKKLAKENKRDFDILDSALKNRNTEIADQIMSKHNIDIAGVRNMLEGIYQRVKETNIDLGYLENYFPRQIKHGMRDDFISTKIKLVEKKLGRELNEEERQEITNNAILGFGKNKYILTTAGNMKERLVDEIDVELEHFYEDSITALVNYIGSINTNIETRKLFGKFNRNIDLYADINNQYKDTIGAYVNDLVIQEKITPAQVKEVTDILSALFTNRMMNGFTQGVTNLSYLATMGQAISFIPQIQDLAFSLYKNGLWGTTKAIANSLKRDAITLDDLSLGDSVRNEIGSNGFLAKQLNFIMSTNGIKLVDGMALKVFVNGRFAEYSDMAKSGKLSKKFVRKLNDVFGEDYQSVLESLKKGEVSTEVKRLIIDDVLNIRPEGATEKSENYNKGALRKVLYTLKQYSLKQIDVYRREVYLEIRNGIQQKDNAMVASGLKNFAMLTLFLVLMGMGADKLKDWILGRETSVSDMVLNNMLKLVAINQYTLDTASREGAGKAFLYSVAPVQATVPWDVSQGIFKDFVMLANGELSLKESQSLKYIPYAGRIVYNRFGKGADTNKTNAQKADKENILKDSIENDVGEDIYIEEVAKAKLKNEKKELTPQYEGQLRREYNIYSEYGFNDPYVEALEGAQSNDEKVEILHEIEDELGEDFQDWIEEANYNGLVSDNLYDKFYELD